MTKKNENVLHLEAHPKAVKRALRSTDSGFSVVECRASDNAQGEHGKTTLIYTTKLDDGAHHNALQALTKQTNIEQDLLLRDDEEDA
jgi:hypothetical protein